jgi:hypothetical protein
VVIKPLGYRLRKGSKLLYRQPAFLICTDPLLDLSTLLQAYIDRWEIECNHRDEKSLIGVAQGQVWSPLAVTRLPQFQVAIYSLLLLSSILAYGFQRTTAYLPLPRWRGKSIRPSVLDLLNLLRDQIFARQTQDPATSSIDDFAILPLRTRTPRNPRWGRRRCAQSRLRLWPPPLTLWHKVPISRKAAFQAAVEQTTRGVPTHFSGFMFRIRRVSRRRAQLARISVTDSTIRQPVGGRPVTSRLWTWRGATSTSQPKQT